MSTIDQLQKLELMLTGDRNTLNELLRVVRTLRRHLLYAEKELKRAQGTKAFYVLQKAYSAQDAKANEILSQQAVDQALAVPAAIARPSVAKKSVRRVKGRIPQDSPVIEPKPWRWSAVARTLVQAAFAGDRLPQDWEELFLTGYGPNWAEIQVWTLPGFWRRTGITLQQESSSVNSPIRETVLRALDILLDARNSEIMRVTTDITEVVTLSRKFSDVEDWVASLRQINSASLE